MNPLIQLKTIPPLLITITLLCFGLLPKAQAVSPPPDGGYPGANTAEGDFALLNLTSGINNTAVGKDALLHNTTGGFNVGIGSGALASNTTGSFNMAVGTQALTKSTASFNLAIGFRVGFMNTTGRHLTGIGAAALQENTTASFNTAIGAAALQKNTTGENNTAIGAGALNQNNGDQNVAIGEDAMINATLAFSNTVVGSLAGTNIVTGVSDTYIGAFVQAAADENFTVRIADNLNTIPGAACFIGGITGNVGANFTSTVVIDPLTGQLGTVGSSVRFKKDIDPMGKTSEAIFSLKPVSFHYKNDKTNTPQFGLIAEDVAKVNPALIGVDKEGKPHSVRYDDINAMLLNEFLKEHRRVEDQVRKLQRQENRAEQEEARLAKQDAIVAQQQKQIQALTAGLQKVSAQLEASKPAPRVVNNP